MGYRVAVVGATGAVGREMLKTLAERRFPVDEVAALASGRSTGSEISFAGTLTSPPWTMSLMERSAIMPFTARRM